ncbi:MAG: hypothetical protein U5K51_12430 [Flavobacteriaceae bacterium]|nr:hypothetical protein [Flavobacteriaceae bacterium]
MDIKVGPDGNKANTAIPEYKIIHENETGVYSEIEKINIKLQKMGYLQNKLDTLIIADTLYTAFFIPGTELKK